MNLKSKRIGIWGLGIGGKAIVEFLANYNDCELFVFDKKVLSAQEHLFLKKNKTCQVNDLNYFLDHCDFVFPSAGIDLRLYKLYKPKFLAELDLFQMYFKKPIIAITGTLGKTTVTTTLAQILKSAGKKVVVGGNVGVGLCSLLCHDDDIDYAVVEVSSFQLELCKKFAPRFAVWTNFFPNHLDRHSSLQEYFLAKCKIVRCQRERDVACVPEVMLSAIKNESLYLHRWRIISEEMPSEINPYLPSFGLVDNWKTLAVILNELNLPFELLKNQREVSLEHRVEFVILVNGRSFYNDSKSTVPGATLSAIQRFTQPVILLLGGLSKGISRKHMIEQLGGHVKRVVAFGKEREELAQWCRHYDILVDETPSMSEAVEKAYNESDVGDVILLSPSGSSFDLFKNYQERGALFKELVFTLKDRYE
jgi:UDP-N-acetylmuramoylalanine--D-glutamate ligase